MKVKIHGDHKMVWKSRAREFLLLIDYLYNLNLHSFLLVFKLAIFDGFWNSNRYTSSVPLEKNQSAKILEIPEYS
jgi:hypothetical protein